MVHQVNIKKRGNKSKIKTIKSHYTNWKIKIIIHSSKSINKCSKPLVSDYKLRPFLKLTFLNLNSFAYECKDIQILTWILTVYSKNAQH